MIEYETHGKTTIFNNDKIVGEIESDGYEPVCDKFEITEQEIAAIHKLCDIVGAPYASSAYDITLALHNKLYPDGVIYSKNREERRKERKKKHGT